MTHFRHGKRWSGGSVEAQRAINPLPGVKMHGGQGIPPYAPGGSKWWTQERINKLIYVLNTYDGDIGKASRVLGCPTREIIYKRDDILREQEKNGIKSD